MSQNVSETLTTKTDKELVSLVKNKGDDEAFKEICKRYENIFYKICQKYVSALSHSGIDVQDIFEEKNYIIFHCISTYKSTKKAKLSTWIGNYARYLCLNSINAQRFIMPSSDEEIKKKIEDSQTVQEYFINVNPKEEFDYISNLLSQLKDQRIVEIFKLRYYSGKKMIWAKIAKKMGISTQTAINLHNRGTELIKRKFKSDNISDTI